MFYGISKNYQPQKIQEFLLKVTDKVFIKKQINVLTSFTFPVPIQYHPPQGGPLPVISGVMSPINGLING